MHTGGSPRSGSHILVVRLGAMGDIIHTLPAVASLKHSFPGSRLTWVVEPRWAPLLKGNPFVDHVVLFDRRSGAGLWRTWQALRRERFDFAVDFQGLVKSSLVACGAGADRIFGHHQSSAREPLAALFYSDKIQTRALHAVERALDLAAGAGASTIVQSFPIPQGKAEGSLPTGAFVLASPLSGWGAKQWPLPYYSQLSAHLLRETGMPLVLNGPPAEREKLSDVPDTLTHLSSIDGLIAATRLATAVVGLDSGPLHLAAALGKPGVALFGPTDPARNGPRGGSVTVLRSPRAVTSYKRLSEIDPSMRELSPEAVLEALRPHLARSSAHGGLPGLKRPLFPKPYADFVARLRVSTGFVLVAAFAWFSNPDSRSLAWGFPVALARPRVARLGRRPPGQEPGPGHRRSIRVCAQSALSRDAAGGRGPGDRIAQRRPRHIVRSGFPVASTCPSCSSKSSTCAACFRITRRMPPACPRSVPRMAGALRSEKSFRWRLYVKNREYQAAMGFLAGAFLLIWKALR